MAQTTESDITADPLLWIMSAVAIAFFAILIVAVVSLSSTDDGSSQETPTASATETTDQSEGG